MWVILKLIYHGTTSTGDYSNIYQILCIAKLKVMKQFDYVGKCVSIFKVYIFSFSLFKYWNTLTKKTDCTCWFDWATWAVVWLSYSCCLNCLKLYPDISFDVFYSKNSLYAVVCDIFYNSKLSLWERHRLNLRPIASRSNPVRKFNFNVQINFKLPDNWNNSCKSKHCRFWFVWILTRLHQA